MKRQVCSTFEEKKVAIPFHFVLCSVLPSGLGISWPKYKRIVALLQRAFHWKTLNVEIESPIVESQEGMKYKRMPAPPKHCLQRNTEYWLRRGGGGGLKNVAAIQERQGCHCVGGGLLAPVFVPTHHQYLPWCSQLSFHRLFAHYLRFACSTICSLSSSRICCSPPPSVFAAAYCICNSEFA